MKNVENFQSINKYIDAFLVLTKKKAKMHVNVCLHTG